ncbi:MAG: hypothetical protein QOF33_291, partial [Thermomicrobiales bacterium]|nr:hypothetical protein [Thermomicrobiales bacterium]
MPSLESITATDDQPQINISTDKPRFAIFTAVARYPT